MREIAFLHLGYDKCGSTALQNASVALHDQLQTLGIHYPLPRFHKSHHLIASAFSRTPEKLNFNKALGRSSMPRSKIMQEDMQSLRRYERCINSSSGKLFLSFEGFIWLTESEHIDLLSWLKNFAREVKALIYLRDPLDYAESAISQRARTGRRAKVAFHRHDLHIAKVVSVYGKENVIVRQCSRDALEGGDIRHDCYSLMGLPKEQTHRLLAQEEALAQEANSALSMHGIGISEALLDCLAGSDFLNLPGAEKRFLTVFGDFLNSVSGPKLCLSRYKEIILHYHPQVRMASRYLRREFGIDFDRPGCSRESRSYEERKTDRKKFEALRKRGVYKEVAKLLIRHKSKEMEISCRKFSDLISSNHFDVV